MANNCETANVKLVLHTTDNCGLEGVWLIGEGNFPTQEFNSNEETKGYREKVYENHVWRRNENAALNIWMNVALTFKRAGLISIYYLNLISYLIESKLSYNDTPL